MLMMSGSGTFRTHRSRRRGHRMSVVAKAEDIHSHFGQKATFQPFEMPKVSATMQGDSSIEIVVRSTPEPAITEHQSDSRSGDSAVPHIGGGNHSGVLLFKNMLALTAKRFNDVRISHHHLEICVVRRRNAAGGQGRSRRTS
jgi:hypothetical protein